MLSAVAKVTFNIELTVEVSQPWGTDCTIEQIHKQALENARQDAGEMVKLMNSDPRKVRLLENPRVLVELQKK